VYELVIVGGGPAGLSTALHLERVAPRLAERTLLLERAHYPREKYCAGAVGGRGIRALEQLGIGVDVPSIRIDGFSVAMGEARVSIREAGAAWVIRRDAFDAHLAAQLRGVELRQGARVRGLDRDDRGVTVILDGDERIRARAVVGADGITGVVRAAMGLGRGSLRAQAVEVDSGRVAGDPPADTIHFGFRPELRGYLWDFPTPLDGRVQMSRGAYLLRDRGDADPQAHLRAHLQGRGLEMGAHRIKQLAERGFEPGQPISAPRVILVGEAAGIDFPTGEGIAQAVLQGQLAAG
jgi:flavin-dependent dehydrogenase